MPVFYPKDRMFARLVVKTKFGPFDLDLFMSKNVVATELVWCLQQSKPYYYLMLIGTPAAVETTKALLKAEGIVKL